MGFRALRVINEDRVQGGQGFGAHSHRDMEIISYVLDGALEHKDSMGGSSIIRPGEVQRMSAGTGVTHSEFNASRDELVHFLQIWILPARPGGKPGYEQKAFPEAERRGKLRLVASPDGRDGSVTIAQDVSLYTSLPRTGETLRHELGPGRHAWVHVARGQVEIGGEQLEAGDAVAVSDARGLELTGRDSSEVLLFDLA
jgi:redox-sensitive bicupin YhaK (pirin superfamily)